MAKLGGVPREGTVRMHVPGGEAVQGSNRPDTKEADENRQYLSRTPIESGPLQTLSEAEALAQTERDPEVDRKALTVQDMARAVTMDYLKKVQRPPNTPKDLLDLCQLLSFQKAIPQALAVLERYKTLHGETKQYLSYRTQVLIRANDSVGALSEARALFKMCPGDPAALSALGRALLFRSEALRAEGKPQTLVREPLGEALMAMVTSPFMCDPAVLPTLAMLHEAMGDSEHATDLAMQAYDTDSSLDAVFEAAAFLGKCQVVFDVVQQALDQRRVDFTMKLVTSPFAQRAFDCEEGQALMMKATMNEEELTVSRAFLAHSYPAWLAAAPEGH